MSRVVGWWYGNIFRRLSAPELLSQVGNKGEAPVFVGLGTNVHGWSLPILGRSRESCGVVVSPKMSASGDVGNYSTWRQEKAKRRRIIQKGGTAKG